MDRFKRILPAILMIIFEVAVGVLLLIDAQKFTTTVFIVFGCVLIICAIVLLVRYLVDRKKAAKDSTGQTSASVITLIDAIAAFVFGAVFAFGSSILYGLTGLMLVFYGAVMIVKGIFKISDYISLKKGGYGVSTLVLIIGILSIVLGVLIIFNPFGALDVVFTIAGIYLIIEAVFDIVALIMGMKISKAIEAEAVVIDDEPDVYNLKNFEE